MGLEEKEEKTVFSYTPNPNIKLVLNGGGLTLDSATVPVEWHFSDELIAKKPQYIVICDHENSLEELSREIEFNYGYRYVSAVKDLMGYVQIHRSGRHSFIAFVFCGKKNDALKQAREFIQKVNRHYYAMSISYEDIARGKTRCGDEVIAVEFEVPKELFAKKPETRFSRLVWSWVNRWFDTQPVDQCDYRKRKIIAFTVQPFIFLIGRLVAGIFGTLYTLIGAFLLLFCGYRPIPMWKNIALTWKASEEFDINLFRFPHKWRQWTDKWTYDRELETPPKLIPIWAVPAIIVVFGLIILVLSIFFFNYPTFIWIAIVIIVIMAVITAIALIMKRRVVKIRVVKIEEARKTRKDKDIEDIYLQYLRTHANLSNTPDTVDLKTVLPKVDIMTRFSLNLWALKAQVCRPFEK